MERLFHLKILALYELQIHFPFIVPFFHYPKKKYIFSLLLNIKKNENR